MSDLVNRLRTGVFRTNKDVIEAADERLTAENNALNLYHAQYLNDESIKIAELEVALAECRKDAERFRFIANTSEWAACKYTKGFGWCTVLREEIDAAMEAKL